MGLSLISSSDRRMRNPYAANPDDCIRSSLAAKLSTIWVENMTMSWLQFGQQPMWDRLKPQRSNWSRIGYKAFKEFADELMLPAGSSWWYSTAYWWMFCLYHIISSAFIAVQPSAEASCPVQTTLHRSYSGVLLWAFSATYIYTGRILCSNPFLAQSQIEAAQAEWEL